MAIPDYQSIMWPLPLHTGFHSARWNRKSFFALELAYTRLKCGQYYLE